MKEGKSRFDSEEVHIVYYTFHYVAGHALGTVALFWTDLVPGLGYSKNITEFGRK